MTTRFSRGRAGSRGDRPRTPARQRWQRATRRGVSWRSHTFSDGVHVITLTGPLDADAAGAVGERVRELIARGSRRLVLDVSSAAADPRGWREQSFLAGILDAHAPGCRIVVVVAEPVAVVRDLLPAGIALAHGLSEARRLLDPERAAAPDGERLAPAHGLTRRDRHDLTRRQSLRWAESAAAQGDYETALAWLASAEEPEQPLSPAWTLRREQWRSAGAAERR